MSAFRKVFKRSPICFLSNIHFCIFFVDKYANLHYNCGMTKKDNEIDGRVEKKERELKARLAYNGFNQRDVARETKMHFTLVNKTIKGHRKSKRVLNFIEQLPLGERVG